MSYNPFDKPLKAVARSDLKRLRLVKEGWFVEYKENIVSSRAIAKSISAFANTHGGWLFFGIAELSKENPVAGTFKGLARSECEAALQTIRSAVASQLSPTPHFETRAFFGPLQAIGLSADRAIIAIYVPSGTNAPYIHGDGRVYRRVADSAEPKPESDRYILDSLWRRSEEFERHTKAWIDRGLDLTDDEADKPHLRLMITPDLWGEHDINLDVNLSEFRDVMQRQVEGLPSLVYDQFYSTPQGYVARGTKGNDPLRLGLTWTVRPDLTCDISLALGCYYSQSLVDYKEYVPDRGKRSRYLSIMRKYGFSSFRLIDVDTALLLTLCIATTYRELCHRAGWSGDWFAKAQGFNLNRCMPYISSDKILDTFENYGIPMSLRGAQTSPPGWSGHSFHRVQPHHQGPTLGQRVFDGIGLFAPIAKLLGLSMSDHAVSDDDYASLVGELYSVGLAAVNSQSSAP